MIGLLEGRVVDLAERAVILQAGGVGYEVFVTGAARVACEQAANAGNPALLRIHTHVREDQFTLFGFSSLKERELFRLLITVSGVGPKSALDVLTATPEDVVQAIQQENLVFLTQCPGIGKKTAERLILDLKDKLIGWETTGTTIASGPQRTHSGQLEENYHDVIEALVRLGYDRRHILPVLSRFVEEQGSLVPTEEEAIRFCLSHL